MALQFVSASAGVACWQPATERWKTKLARASYTVPAGNRLVIEVVSAYSVGTAGHNDGAVALQMVTKLNGSNHVQYLPMERTFLMTAYADEDTVVCWNYAFVLNGPVGVPRVAVTGHLVAQP